MNSVSMDCRGSGTAQATEASPQDLSARPDEQWPFYADDEIEAVVRVLRSGRVNQWTGPEVFAFQDAFSARFGLGRGIAVANGSVALELALRAFGIGPGDEVIVSPRSFVASAFCAMLVGATSVFADVDPDSGNITPETVERVLTDRTRAIIPVHLAGWPADISGSPAWSRAVASGSLRTALRRMAQKSTAEASAASEMPPHSLSARTRSFPQAAKAGSPASVTKKPGNGRGRSRTTERITARSGFRVLRGNFAGSTTRSVRTGASRVRKPQSGLSSWKNSMNGGTRALATHRYGWMR